MLARTLLIPALLLLVTTPLASADPDPIYDANLQQVHDVASAAPCHVKVYDDHPPFFTTSQC
jgi:hypothetical protein